MLTGTLRNQIDRIWDSFWAGGIANPMEVLEQITYLLFLRRLDDQQTLMENRASRVGGPIEQPVFPAGNDEKGRPFDDLRWSRFKGFEPREMYSVVAEHVFPFLRTLGVKGSSYDATPRHIIRLMVELAAPTPRDVICDPAAGTCGFLVVAGEYLRDKYPQLLHDTAQRTHFHHGMFHGYDFDHTMLRIGSMNMALHGVDGPDIRYRDSLAQDHADDAETYTLILANPPFAGSLDYEATAKDLQAIVKTKKTELLFMALFLRLLKPGGRAAVVVPDGVLFGSSKAHKELRRLLVDGHKLDAVISLPGGVFKPYAGVSTAILLFTKTNSGGTDQVWFYDLRADGWSLDDKRQPLLAEEKLGMAAGEVLSETEHTKNNLPDVLARWAERAGTERDRPRTAQSFCVPRADIEANGYDLSLNWYREVVHEVVAHRSPGEILAELEALELEIQRGMKELAGMLN